MNQGFDVIVLGGGAAGLMCAIEAGKRGRSVAVLERSERIGKKILISGGGRCNFTNLHCQADNFLSANPHFAKSALATYTPSDFISLVERYRIPYHEKTRGQLFCDRSARDIVNLLQCECDRAGVHIHTNTQIEKVEHSESFKVATAKQEFHGRSLVVATGGLSIPKIGATSLGYELARQFSLKIVPPRPALVPLLWNAQDLQRYSGLSGISLEVGVSAGRQSFQDKMLFTHVGLSGPAILQISSYWDPSSSLTVDLAPGQELTATLRAESRRDLHGLMAAFRKILPQRLADRWLELHPPSGWTNQALSELERLAHHWNIQPSGSEGYGKAEVTGGGVDTNELSAKTMECRKVPGLYFIGEVVDVTGQLGGFNFQWAWASGYCAGQVV